MSILSVHDLQGISAYQNKIRVPSGHQLNVDGAFKLPVWTSSTRPSSPDVGLFGYNSEVSQLELWDGSDWAALSISSGPTLGDGSSAATAPPHARELAELGYPSGVYWIKPTGQVAVQTYVDMSNDDGSGGGWCKIHNAWTSGSANDRTNSGYNETALQTGVHTASEAIMTSAWMNATSFEAWRVINESSGNRKVRLYWTKSQLSDGNTWAYHTSDAASNGGSATVNGSYKWGTGPSGGGWTGGGTFYAAYNANHGICLGAFGNGASYVASAGNFHICCNRWCCGSPSVGMWFNGYSWPSFDDSGLISGSGSTYNATGWVR